MAWTQADVDALKTAMATATLEVEFEGPPKRRVRYHSLNEMRELLADMVREVSASTGGVTYSLASTSKGF